MIIILSAVPQGDPGFGLPGPPGPPGLPGRPSKSSLSVGFLLKRLLFVPHPVISQTSLMLCVKHLHQRRRKVTQFESSV